MNYQRDSGQNFSEQLRTTTENNSENGVFSEVTYYITRLRSSIYSIFIAQVNGIRNNTKYTQGNLVVTSADTSNTRFTLLNGNLLVSCPTEEVYALDNNGHLICTTTLKT